MISEQPIDRLPRLADPYFRSGWLNAKTKGGRDFGPDGSDMAYVSTPIDERVGMTFDGVGDYLSRAEADWRSADSQGTISAWIKRDAAGVSHTIISSADTGSLLYYIQLTIFNDLLLFVQKDNDTLGSVLGSTTLAAGQWFHVAVTSSGTAWKLYVNGTAETLTELGNNGDWLADTTLRDNICIGMLCRSADVNPFDGTIKDVRYWSRELSADEIKYMYNAGVPDDSLSLLVQDGIQDRSRYVHALTRSGEIVVGHGMDFDGVDDAIDAGDIGNLQSISTWINPDTATEQILRIDVDKYIHIVAGTVTYVGITPVATYVNGAISTTLGADFWQHLVCVFEEDAASNFELGWDGTNYGDIKLRDVRAFSAAKSADWVKELYERTRIFY